MKIAFVGAHCVGKTTLAEALSKKTSLPFLKLDEAAKIGQELAPGLRLDEIPHDKQKELQRVYFENATALQRKLGSFILDCCSLTCMPYRKLLNVPFQFGTDAQFSVDSVRQMDYIFYLPPEIPYESGQFRPKDESTRDFIDKEVLQLLDGEEIPYTTLYGTVNQRVEQVLATTGMKDTSKERVPVENYIAFEGLPGCGKTTQIEMLKESLEDYGYKVHVCERTSDDVHKAEIRELYKDTQSNARKLLDYHIGAFKEQQSFNKIGERLKRGEIVITDRHIPTVLTFHEALGFIPKHEILRSIGTIVRPGKTIYLDIPPSLAISRVIERGESGETSAKKNFVTQSEVRRNYLHWVKSAVGATQVCASQNPEMIHRNIIKSLGFRPNFDGILATSKHIEEMYSRQGTYKWTEKEVLLDMQYQIGQMAKNNLQRRGMCQIQGNNYYSELELDIADMIYLCSLLADKSKIDLDKAFSRHTKVEATKIKRRLEKMKGRGEEHLI